MKIAVYHIDAFADRVFGGNPAAVCPLNDWLSDEHLQAIAAEHNLSETAFLVGRQGCYDLRWFTPQVEVDLCGHATLAAAFVVREYLEPGCDRVRFRTKSGELAVTHESGRLAMDFPARMPAACTPPAELLDGLGRRPREVLLSRDYLAVYDTQAEVRDLAPDMRLFKCLPSLGVIATAPGGAARGPAAIPAVDFISRFFAPAAGVDEDPVTGSAHCTLIPYWSRRLGKTSLFARQVSRRGGELWCTDRGERVTIAGQAVLFSQGVISL
jgi:predicted PhzF superfamily epimerase YddE/YHI9